MQLAGGQPRQPLALLLLGAEAQDRHGAERDGGLERDRDRRVDPGELLDGDAQREVVAAHAAVLLGDRQAEQPEPPHPGDDLVGELALGVQVADDRGDLLARELRHARAQRLVLVGQTQVHRAPRVAGRRRRRRRPGGTCCSRTPRGYPAAATGRVRDVPHHRPPAPCAEPGSTDQDRSPVRSLGSDERVESPGDRCLPPRCRVDALRVGASRPPHPRGRQVRRRRASSRSSSTSACSTCCASPAARARCTTSR